MFTALAKAYGGYGVGRQNQQQEQDRRAQLAQTAADQASADAYRQQQLQQQAEELAQRKILNTGTLRGQGLDAQGNPLAPLPITGLPTPGSMVPGALIPSGTKNKAGQPVGPPAPGVPTAAPEWTGDQYREAARQATEAGRGDLVAHYTALATSADTGDWRQSIANLNTVKGDEITQGKIPLDAAKAALARAMPGIDYAKIKASVDNATGRNQATIKAAQLHSNAQVAAAGLSNDGRILAAQIIGYNALQGKVSEAATNQAIQAAHDAERFAGVQAAHGDVTGGGYQPPAPAPAPSITFAPSIILGQDGKPHTVNVPQIKPGGNAGEDPKAAHARVVTQVKNEIRAGVTPRALVDEARSHKTADNDIRVILQEAGVKRADIDDAFKAKLGPLALPWGR